MKLLYTFSLTSYTAGNISWGWWLKLLCEDLWALKGLLVCLCPVIVRICQSPKQLCWQLPTLKWVKSYLFQIFLPYWGHPNSTDDCTGQDAECISKAMRQWFCTCTNCSYEKIEKQTNDLLKWICIFFSLNIKAKLVMCGSCSVFIRPDAVNTLHYWDYITVISPNSNSDIISECCGCWDQQMSFYVISRQAWNET